MLGPFAGELRWLSNFWQVPGGVEFEGVKYPTVEHAFQASKTLVAEDRAIILRLSAADAKKAGRQLVLRPDWDEVKAPIMLDLLRKKFRQYDLRDRLLATGEEDIVELNTWHDNYWGSCTCPKCSNKGMNRLGQLLMLIRQQIREER